MSLAIPTLFKRDVHGFVYDEVQPTGDIVVNGYCRATALILDGTTVRVMSTPNGIEYQKAVVVAHNSGKIPPEYREIIATNDWATRAWVAINADEEPGLTQGLGSASLNRTGEVVVIGDGSVFVSHWAARISAPTLPTFKNMKQWFASDPLSEGVGGVVWQSPGNAPIFKLKPSDFSPE